MHHISWWKKLTISYKKHKQKHKDVYEYLEERWREFEKKFWEKHPNEKYCHICGSTKKIELHHIIPRHIAPDKILDESNLLPLCHCCHFKFAHFEDWDDWNPNILENAISIYSIIQDSKKIADLKKNLIVEQLRGTAS